MRGGQTSCNNWAWLRRKTIAGVRLAVGADRYLSSKENIEPTGETRPFATEMEIGLSCSCRIHDSCNLLREIESDEVEESQPLSLEPEMHRRAYEDHSRFLTILSLCRFKFRSESTEIDESEELQTTSSKPRSVDPSENCTEETSKPIFGFYKILAFVWSRLENLGNWWNCNFLEHEIDWFARTCVQETSKVVLDLSVSSFSVLLPMNRNKLKELQLKNGTEQSSMIVLGWFKIQFSIWFLLSQTGNVLVIEINGLEWKSTEDYSWLRLDFIALFAFHFGSSKSRNWRNCVQPKSLRSRTMGAIENE